MKIKTLIIVLSHRCIRSFTADLFYALFITRNLFTVPFKKYFIRLFICVVYTRKINTNLKNIKILQFIYESYSCVILLRRVIAWNDINRGTRNGNNIVVDIQNIGFNGVVFRTPSKADVFSPCSSRESYII